MRRARARESLQRPDARIFVAEAADELVGQLGISLRRRGLYEFGMVVAEGRRRQGIGSALLAAAIAWSRAAGAHKIVLEVFPHNAAARALYVKLGFREEGYFHRHVRRKNGELWDCIPMGLVLEDALNS